MHVGVRSLCYMTTHPSPHGPTAHDLPLIVRGFGRDGSSWVEAMVKISFRIFQKLLQCSRIEYSEIGIIKYRVLEISILEACPKLYIIRLSSARHVY